MQQSHSEGQHKNTGRWSKEEHQKFMYAIMQYGKDWKKVQQYVQTRSGSQVRSHAQKFFNKLQKSTQHKEGKETPVRPHPEFSETQFDMEREMGNEATPCTPIELISLIKKQSKEEGGRVNLGTFKKRLQEQTKKAQSSQMPESLARQKSYKSMSNILSAYEEINQNNKQVKEEDESFLIHLTKKYKKFFGVEDFDKLIDYHQPLKDNIKQMEGAVRKRSFTLPEGSELEGEELEEKIEQIKKQIMKDSNQKKEEKSDEHKETIKTKNEGQVPQNLNRLSTIREKSRQEEELPSKSNIQEIQSEKNEDKK